MDIRSINTAAGGSYGNDNQDSSQQASPPPPPSSDVSNFNSAMNSSSASCENCSGCPSCSGGDKSGSNPLDDPKTKEMLAQVLQLVQQLLEKVESSEPGNNKGGSTASPNGGVNPVEGAGSGGGADNQGSGGNGGSGSNERIPPPSENIQQLNLGGKTVTVGGDGTGTASAEEVAKTAQSIEHMYQNSPTFKDMIDNSSDPSFEVSVGRRDDNTSWGNTEGRVFMNINNIDPGNSDSWQSLLSHEFAHASIDLGHGAEMENLEQRAAREA